jgi:hypothetical protein
MAENVYMLKVGANASGEITKCLSAKSAPSHVRLATLAPLSNWGYPPGSEGALIAVNDRGLVFGVDGNDGVPRAFVPWQNVSYVADGSTMKK